MPTIPNIDEYTGNTPVPGQPQPEFNQNMADELNYMNQLPNNLNPAIDEINNTADKITADKEAVTTLKDESEAARDAAQGFANDAESFSDASAASANYIGEFVQGTTSAVKGGSYLYDGVIWRCVSNTTDSPDLNPSAWVAGYSDRDAIARANNTTVDDVLMIKASELPSSYNNQNFLYLSDEQITVELWGDNTSVTEIQSYTANDFAGYDVTTDQGVVEFVSPQISALRKEGRLSAWGALEDGVSDESGALTKALQYGRVALRDDVTYKASNLPIINNSVKISGRSVLEIGSKLHIQGSITNSGASVADGITNLKNGDLTLPVSDSSLFAVGEIFIIQDETNFSFSPYRTYYTKGDYLKVKSISTGVLTLEWPIGRDYTINANFNIYKLDMPTVSITGGVEIKGGDGGAAVRIELCRDVKVECKTSSEIGQSSLDINRCFSVDINQGSHSCNTPTDQQQYGCVIRSSWNVTSSGVYYHGSRHGFATGSTTGAGYIQSNQIWIYGGQTSSTTSFGSDFHGHIENSGYVNVEHKTGLSLSGKNVSANGGTSESKIPFVPAVGFREIAGGVVRYSNMSIKQLATDNFPSDSRSPLDQFSTDEMDAAIEDFSIEYENINIEFDSSYNSFISRCTVNSPNNIRFNLSYKNINLVGSNVSLTGFLRMGQVSNAKLNNLTIENIKLNGNVIDHWTDNLADYSVENETHWTLPEFTNSGLCTLSIGDQVSPETSVVPEVKSSEMKYDILTSTDGNGNGGPPIYISFNSRNNLDTDCKVRLWALEGAVNQEINEQVNVNFFMRNKVYKSALSPV